MLYNDYRGIKLSRLGFGCMRFFCDPVTGEIDQNKVQNMFDYAIENGVNYFDTAYPYLNGQSEIAMAKALKKYSRDQYYIADKFPGHSLPGPVDNIELFNVSLKKCNVDYFDFYLLHNITEWSVKIYESDEYHILSDMIRLREEGKIRFLGFSFHGGVELLREFLDRHEGVFDFVQIQCNYLDWTLQNAKEKYDIITERGLGVWVMEPVRGGKLANLSVDDQSALQSLKKDASNASFAFRFLQELPNVKMILSGMNELDQVVDNINTFSKEEPLKDEERKTLFAIADKMKNGVPCTACRYCCDGCPVHLDIPMLIDCYNTTKIEFNINASMRLDGLADEKKPSACIQCGQCSHACPQSIDVPSVLSELNDIYTKGPKWADMAKSRVELVKKDLSILNYIEFREISQDEAILTAELEAICFPPNEACSEKMMMERVRKAPEMFLVAIDKRNGKMAGFLNGLATDEEIFRDEFFENPELYNPKGKNVLLLGLNIHPEYRRQGLASELMEQFAMKEKANGREKLVLTCHEEKIDMYKKMKYEHKGMSASFWGGVSWHEMIRVL